MNLRVTEFNDHVSFLQHKGFFIKKIRVSLIEVLVERMNY